jgi:hypothetical protein
MRHLILTAAFSLISCVATASAIEVIKGPHAISGSIITVTCKQCPPLKKDERKQEYLVPALASGTQETAIRDVDGKKEAVRTEAWMGGSPVVYVSTARTWLPLDDKGTMLATAPGESPATETVTAPSDGIDHQLNTAAVIGVQPPITANMGATPTAELTETAQGPVTVPDFSDFHLRQ